MKILKLSNAAYHYYRDKVKGNITITKEQAARKLSRNILLAKEVKLKSKLDRLLGKKLFHYGNLHITTQWNKVISIKNHRTGKHYGNWKLDKEKYIKLSKELGITDIKFKKK
ncbi:hypothetical protein KDN24_06905 [Bacillus sp. Bva_UNVM-123]|uniref:hypothetical protein n=1 Tax=Bacillus sp. Bva_UNVM-123 TaxID=2829798 RepID=UPI00391EF280